MSSSTGIELLHFVQDTVNFVGVKNVHFDDLRRADSLESSTYSIPAMDVEHTLDLTTKQSAGFKQVSHASHLDA